MNKTRLDLEHTLTNQKNIMENWANERMNEVRYLANLPATTELQLEQMVQTFQNFLKYHRELESVVFLDQEGFVVIDSGLDHGLVQSNVSLKDRDYFIAAEQGKEYMHAVVNSRASEKPVIIFSVPILSAGNQFQGVVFGAVHLSKVSEMLYESLQGESGQGFLINDEGTVITQIAKNGKQRLEKQTLATDLVEDITNGQQLTFNSYENHRGEEVFGSYVPLMEGRYYLINEINKSEVLQSHYQMIGVILAITLVIVIIGTGLIVPVSRHLLRPFVLLVEAINKIKAGNYRTQLDPNTFKPSPLELRQIMEVFNEMAATIQHNYEILENLSRTDELTEVGNRRFFEEHLEREWQRARREVKPLSLAFIDIDYFKEYNDTYGHQTGDECLKSVSRSIENTVKNQTNLIARYGGEEFVIIFPETDNENAARLVDNIRKQVETLHIPHAKNEASHYVTVSIGVASIVPTAGQTKASFIELADQALYEAKSQGRNRVVRRSR